MLTKIRKLGDPILTTATNRVKSIDEIDENLIDQMFEVMHNSGGVGLAANQIGITKSIFVYDDQEGNEGFVINPFITPVDEEVYLAPEGCLSIPGMHHDTPRYKRINMRGTTSFDGTISAWENISGLLGQIFQHETDHLRGKLYISLLPKETQMAIVLANQVI